MSDTPTSNDKLVEHLTGERDYLIAALRGEIEGARRSLDDAARELDNGRAPNALMLGNFTREAGHMNGTSAELGAVLDALRYIGGGES